MVRFYTVDLGPLHNLLNCEILEYMFYQHGHSDQSNRLMERPSIDHRRSRTVPWFEDNRSSYQHHAEYLKKLSTLREELILQEQTHLANALDRLRMRQYNKDNALARSKSKDFLPDSRRSLMTTIEHFQRMRPKKSPPHISPLEGKQILEPQTYKPVKSPQLSEKGLMSQRSLDDSIRTNLQRIPQTTVQPTSSIPNIGRKSITKSKELVLDGSPIHKRRLMPSREEKDAQDFNPFKAVYKGNKGTRLRRLVRPDEDELDLRAQAINFESLSDKDKINLDKLKEFYCIYYLPTNTPTNASDDEESMEFPEDNFVQEPVDFHHDKKKRLTLLESRPKVFQEDGLEISPRKPQGEQSNGIPGGLILNGQGIRDQEVTQQAESESFTIYGDKKCSVPPRKQIIVDMPSIVFNNATPENENVSVSERKRRSMLQKTFKQNEIRQRELRNLFDDVRELNKRSDELTESIKSSSD
ncbi:uncharacterized protein LOC130051891 isoform X5 [Ostrea edulis]|uniref:uncharacterized protein LOC130051891 isoform X5 n=1 Tax=Ostrea edulis TaxID=37623 RepID=UPI0024AF0161|nr:uncharacterized protein LOC130051891 isoform X5 [Ostrea edulis]